MGIINKALGFIEFGAQCKHYCIDFRAQCRYCLLTLGPNVGINYLKT